MKVTLSPRAEKQLRRLSKVNQIIVAKKIRSIRDKDAVSGEEKLRGFGDVFKVKVGDYRIVYRRTKGQMYIILVGHRRDIYKLVDRLLS